MTRQVASVINAQSCVSVWPTRPSSVNLCLVPTDFNVHTGTTSTVCNNNNNNNNNISLMFVVPTITVMPKYVIFRSASKAVRHHSDEEDFRQTQVCCVVGGLVVQCLGRRTCDQQVASSTSGRALSGQYLMGDRLCTGKPSRHVTSHPGQLSLPSLRNR